MDLFQARMRRYVVMAVVLGMAVRSAGGEEESNIPIPKVYDGFVLGSMKPDVIVVEAYYDLLCPNCKAVDPVFKKVMELYKDKARFIVHTFPLPYHLNSYLAAQAAHAIAAHNRSQVWTWIDGVFKYQNQFGNQLTGDKTGNEIRQMYEDLAGKLGIDSDVVKRGFHDASADGATRISWKYACSRTVSGTPTFMVNGIILSPGSAGWSLNDWIHLLDSLLELPSSPTLFQHLS